MISHDDLCQHGISYAFSCPECKHEENLASYRQMAAGHTGALDVQVGGSHYKDMKIQPVEFVHANGIGFLAGNVIKYVCRYATKNGRADLEKARHYIDLLIELEYGSKDS